jgi:hypothetical protein
MWKAVDPFAWNLIESDQRLVSSGDLWPAPDPVATKQERALYVECAQGKTVFERAVLHPCTSQPADAFPEPGNNQVIGQRAATWPVWQWMKEDVAGYPPGLRVDG